MRHGKTGSCAILLLATLALGGCGGHDGKDGADIRVTGEDGNVVASADGQTGRVSLKLPGFSANVRLPRLNLDADDIDIDGVKLYPGSAVNGVDVKAGKPGAEDRVEIRFTAPAAPAQVRDYFVSAFRDEGMTVAARGNGLAGTGRDGDPFSIDLTPEKGGTAGMIAMSSSD